MCLLRSAPYHIDGDVRPESDVDGRVELGEDVEDLGEAGDVGREVAGAGEVGEVAGRGGRGQKRVKYSGERNCIVRIGKLSKEWKIFFLENREGAFY